ncbi:hypothetical protein CC1G_10069 [Coprinopsis cinerea okayama7|uniref:Uncharacterized protein n=1 Tax=Coprinopsis cinerea (strain Okayama-7 / 130 / ATCC MYA-4618 / FGSC 9003) TaxID=240176 RepID=A8NV01_COPC7|nr:hypothetical protein CC1G_10069 [Coprinopsis cinerea okayama7\|eukprot:XP_001836575.1 hypothetical protein CC1G_10069 [Coprinopsis cinerea okayama7\
MVKFTSKLFAALAVATAVLVHSATGTGAPEKRDIVEISTPGVTQTPVLDEASGKPKVFTFHRFTPFPGGFAEVFMKTESCPAGSGYNRFQRMQYTTSFSHKHSSPLDNPIKGILSSLFPGSIGHRTRRRPVHLRRSSRNRGVLPADPFFSPQIQRRGRRNQWYRRDTISDHEDVLFRRFLEDEEGYLARDVEDLADIALREEVLDLIARFEELEEYGAYY